MTDRRAFLTGMAGLGMLAGCQQISFQRPSVATGIVDAHCHFFNGRDIPVFGFLEQVNFTSGLDVIGAGVSKSALVRMLVAVLRSGAPDARQEMDWLDSKGAAPAPNRDELLAQDQARVAQVLTDYQSRSGPQLEQGIVEVQGIGPAARSLTMRAAAPPSMTAREDAGLLAALEAEAGLPPAPPGVMELLPSETAGSTLAQPEPVARSRADAVAAAAFERRPDGTYTRISPLFALLRWAAMLTRYRSQIASEAIYWYGGAGGTQIYCNALVDLEMWFRMSDTDLSPLVDQVAVMGRIARSESRAMIMNFVPFCPLRAVVEPGQPLALVREAIEMHGFAGVKLYPPMGFKPMGNENVSFAHSSEPGFGAAEGRAMDRALAELYAWCAANDVPILSHASDSMQAGPGTGAYASPALWRPVLDQYPLRVSLAHVGGFPGHQVPPGGDPDWVARLDALLVGHEGLYFDTGYLSEADESSPRRAAVLTEMRRLLSRETTRQRMLYGSDWSMVGREPDYPRYQSQVHAFLTQALPAGDTGGLAAIMGGNAMRWLGLDRRGAQYARLEAVFGGRAAWRRLTP